MRQRCVPRHLTNPIALLMNFRNLMIPALIPFCASASFVQAQQLNADYPEIRLADGRVLSEACVSTFNKKNLTFCIGHRHGIETAVPWGAIPVVWQSAFPLEGADAQRGRSRWQRQRKRVNQWWDEL